MANFSPVAPGEHEIGLQAFGCMETNLGIEMGTNNGIELARNRSVHLARGRRGDAPV
jgi:hypothetical protein